MGNIDNPQIPSEAQRMDFPEGAYVVADAEAVAGLDFALAERRSSLAIHEVVLPLEERIPDEVTRKASIVVVQVDPASARSMQRIADLRSARPFMPLIVALRNADLALVRSLIRQGVNDVVTLPFDYDQLAGALLDASAGAEQTSTGSAPAGPLYSVVGSIGGSGATTVATHLAAALADEQAGCCLVDLDVQFGTAASYMNVAQERSITDLLDAKLRLDADLLRSVATDVRDGMNLVTAPQAILPLDQVDVDQLLKVLACARRSYGSVVLDLPVDFTNWSVSAILSSSTVLVVVELSITSLRQARRRLDFLTEMGLERRKIFAVVNRAERRLFGRIKPGDVETTLGIPVIGTIANEPGVVGPAQDQGLLVQDLQARNAFAKDIGKLAEALQKVGVES